MNQNEVVESYNEEAKYWNPLMIHGEDMKIVNKPFFDLLEKYDANTIFDVGCGSGLHGVQFAKMGYNVMGLDITPNMIEEANKNAMGLKNIQFVCEDINKYQTDVKYDAIWACNSLHNLQYPILIKAIDKIVSLLKDNNGILAITMRKGSYEGIMVRNNIERYYRYSSPREIRGLLKQYPLVWQTTTYKVWMGVPYFSIYYVKRG